jgi:hypothetical protein
VAAREELIKQINLYKLDKVVKIILSVLLFVCLTDAPYGYYQFVRFFSLIVFVVLAYHTNQQGRNTEMIIYGSLALLFQPFFKIALGRQLWNMVDVVVGLGLLISIFIKPKGNQS